MTQSPSVTYTNPRNSFIALGMSPEQVDLYCAAPELLAALERVRCFEQRISACGSDGGQRLVADIRAVIAKAKGVSHE